MNHQDGIMREEVKEVVASGEIPLPADVKPEDGFMNVNLNIPKKFYDELMKGNIQPMVEVVKAMAPVQLKVEHKWKSWRNVQKLKSKVAIVGFADTKDEAPYNDDSWEIWGLNSLFEVIPRWNRWFEIHERKNYKWDTDKTIGYGLTREGKPYIDALKKLGVPCYMVEAYDDIENAVRYPIEVMVAEFDPAKRLREFQRPFENSAKADWNGYFTNSISYMIALATYEKYETIGLWGIDMATVAEYSAQRASCEYYVGIAVGRGIDVVIPAGADLLKSRNLYGWEAEIQKNWDTKLAKTKASMEQRAAAAQQQFELARKQLDQYVGAMAAMTEMQKIWDTAHMPSANGGPDVKRDT